MAEISKEAKELRRQYLADWRKKNPNKVKEYNARYWEKKNGGEEMPTQVYNDEFHENLRERVRKHREKTSSEKGCDYCAPFYDEDKDSKDLLAVSITQFPHLAASVWINLGGKLELWVIDDGDNEKTFEKKIKFCPMCGRKLVKNDCQKKV